MSGRDGAPLVCKSKLRPANGDQLLKSAEDVEQIEVEDWLLLQLSSLLRELAESTSQVEEVVEGGSPVLRQLRREEEPGKNTPVPRCRRSRGCSEGAERWGARGTESPGREILTGVTYR